MNYLKSRLLKSYKAFNKSLRHLERAQVKNPAQPLPYPVLFVLGAPRSGTTLVYQSLATAFDFSFFSNAHCFLNGAPWLVERILRPSEKFNTSSFRSNLGRTNGWKAPSECGDFWYRFFRRSPQYVSLTDAGEQQMTALRTALHAFMNASGKPLLIKNLPCVLRLEPLLKVIPEAYFIVVERDETDTAHSILKARKNFSGSYEKWFSIEPPAFEALKKCPPQEQAVRQIRSTYALINQGQAMEPHRFFYLQLEEFCKDTNSMLKQVRSFFTEHKITIPSKNDIPATFPMRSEIAIDKQLYNKLLEYVKKTSV